LEPIKELIEESRLNRKILNACWLMILFALIISLIGILINLKEIRDTFIQELLSFSLLPILYLVIPLVITEGLVKLFKKYEEYIILFAIFITLLLFTLILPMVRGLHYALFLPILIAALYFQPIKVYIMSGLCLASIILLYYFYEPLAIEMTYRGLFTSIGIFVSCTFISIGMIKRGRYILNKLKKSTKNQQDLIVKNIIMDKTNKEDPLTGLYNHKTFHEYLEKLIEQSESSHLPLQLGIIDIDNFKNVNDNYGHWVGDIVLKRVGEQIKAHVTQDDFVSRYGGEEFAVIFTDKNKDESYLLLEQIRIEICSMEHQELNNQAVTVSIGMCSYSKGLGKERFFKAADESLYQAKHKGKNQIVLSSVKGMGGR
jgi:diguanylate cyclase (GGDEF)-like protein